MMITLSGSVVAVIFATTWPHTHVNRPVRYTLQRFPFSAVEDNTEVRISGEENSEQPTARYFEALQSQAV